MCSRIDSAVHPPMEEFNVLETHQGAIKTVTIMIFLSHAGPRRPTQGTSYPCNMVHGPALYVRNRDIHRNDHTMFPRLGSQRSILPWCNSRISRGTRRKNIEPWCYYLCTGPTSPVGRVTPLVLRYFLTYIMCPLLYTAVHPPLVSLKVLQTHQTQKNGIVVSSY